MFIGGDEALLSAMQAAEESFRAGVQIYVGFGFRV